MNELHCKECLFKYLDKQVWKCPRHKGKSGHDLRITLSKLACHFIIETNFKFKR